MKKLFFCALAHLVLCNAYTTAASTHINIQEQHQQTVSEFTHTYLKQLTPEELQFFANLVYVSYALARLDGHIRTHAQKLVYASWIARRELLAYADAQKTMQYIAAMVQDLYQKNAMQRSTFATWQFVTHTAESLEKDSALYQAAEAFRMHAQQAVATWALDDMENIDEQLNESNNILQDTVNAFSSLRSSIHNMQQTDAALEKAEPLAHINAIVRASELGITLEDHCQQVCQTAFELSQPEIDLQAVSADLMYPFYVAAHHELTALEPCYRYIMFDAGKLLAPEEQNQELPQPQD